MLTRRALFGAGAGLAGGLAAGAVGVSAQAQTSPQAKKRLIVDAQTHVWKPEAPDRPWIPGMKPQLPEPFSYDKLLGLMNEAGVDRCVLVPPSWEGDRNDYALEAAAKYPDRFCVMGRIPVADPKSAALLPGWRQQNGMKGIRTTFLGPKQSAPLYDGSIDWLWPAAAKAGVPIMFLAGDQIGKFLPVAERNPELKLIIDHMSLTADVVKAGKADEVVATAASMAKLPNVSVKLSAIGTATQEAYPWRDMTPRIKRLFDAFGPKRCHWGSDQTNSFTKATYRQRVAQFTEVLDFLTEADKDQIMGRSIMDRLEWA